MKRLLLILLLLGCTAACGRAPYDNKPMLGEQIDWSHSLAHDLAAFWPLNEGAGSTVYDATGRNAASTIASGDPTVGTDGLTLDGDDVVSLGQPIGDVLETGNWTIVVRFKPTASMGILNGILSKSYNSPYALSLRADTDPVAELWWSQNNDNLALGFLPTANEWCEIAMAYDSSVGRKCYRDGVYLASDAYTTNPSSQDEDVYLGCDYRPTARRFTGIIGHLAIYSRTLGAAEIASLYIDPYQMFESTPVWAHYSSGAAPPAGGGQVIVISGVGPVLTVILLMTAGLTLVKRDTRGQ